MPEEVVALKRPIDQPTKPAESGGKRRTTLQQWRRRLAIFTFVPFVILPVLLGIAYFGFIASDRYSVEVKFAIRSPTGFSPTDMIGMVTGASTAGSTILDSYIVSDFVESGELLDQLEKRIGIRAIYDNDAADFLMRFDGSNSREDFLDYFSWMRSVYFDTSSQVITLEVQAFTAEDAQLVAREILLLTEELINRLSEQARLDTVRTAESEVARVEKGLRAKRLAVSAFRERHQDIDPLASVGTKQTIVAALENELAASVSERDALLKRLSPSSPQIRIKNDKINALRAQIIDQRARLGSGTDETSESLTKRVGAYEELKVDLEFLERAYVSALSSLEAARLEADRQQRYLATFVRPAVPEEAIYPRRALNILLVVIFSVMGWGISVMVVYIVREHAI